MLGTITRLSYVDYSGITEKEIGGFKVAGGGIDLENNEWESVRQLESESEYILKVEKRHNSKHLYEAMLTEVQVLEVFKGENIIGEIIYLFEPSFINFTNQLYISVFGYNMILSDKEYIVFLKKRNFPKGYRPNKIEEKSFLLTSNCALSKYLISDTFQDVILQANDNIGYKYNEVRDLEVIVTDKKQLNFYNTFKMHVKESYFE